MIRNIVAACAFSLTLGLAAAADVERDRALLVVSGRVESMEQAPGEAGQAWTDVWIVPEGDGAARLHVRVAPTGILAAVEFRLATGDRVQARVFSDVTPFMVQQIRNRETGRVLRLRGLRGEPLWASRRATDGLAGPASSGPGGTGHGGPRVRGGR